MTTVAAIMELCLSRLVGASAEARRPLRFSDHWGILLSQLITLFITPSLYLVMEKVKQENPLEIT